MIRKRINPPAVAIVGTGGMANVHARRFNENPACRLVACCDIDPARARDFAAKHAIPAVFDHLGSMLAESGCDAVSVVTPDATHRDVSLACIKAGKHVLCEKPLALNAADARKMFAAAKKAGVVNMVNFSYREWPCIQGAAAAIARGDIGEIRHVEASYLQGWLANPAWGDWRKTPAWLWRLSSRHGSKGVLGDVGVHILDYATHPCGPLREIFCRLKTFPKTRGNRIGPYVLDANDSATINAQFANGALGVIHATRWAAGHTNRLTLEISGSEGSLAMNSDVSTTSYRVCRGTNLRTATWKEIPCKPVPSNHHKFITAIRANSPATPGFARGTEIQKLLDACFASDRLDRPVRIR
jgi:predicted dehydrogenase